MEEQVGHGGFPEEMDLGLAREELVQGDAFKLSLKR